MPIRFSTEAANADHMRMDASPGMPEEMPGAVGADGTPRDRSDPASRADRSGRAPRREPRGAAVREEQDKQTPAKPGKDINAAGFIKDKDAGKP